MPEAEIECPHCLFSKIVPTEKFTTPNMSVKCPKCGKMFNVTGNEEQKDISEASDVPVGGLLSSVDKFMIFAGLSLLFTYQSSYPSIIYFKISKLAEGLGLGSFPMPGTIIPTIVYFVIFYKIFASIFSRFSILERLHIEYFKRKLYLCSLAFIAVHFFGNFIAPKIFSPGFSVPSNISTFGLLAAQISLAVATAILLIGVSPKPKNSTN